MIVYNTTFHIAQEAVEECLDFFKKQYIPQATASGLLGEPRLMRVMHTDEGEGGSSYSLQFRTENPATLQDWLEKEGTLLHRELVKRFGHRVAGFSTLLEEITL